MNDGPSGYETAARMTFGVAVAIGIGTGVALGVAFDNMAVGIAVGIAIGGLIMLAPRAFGRWSARRRDDE